MQELGEHRDSKRLLAISLRHFGYKVKDIALLTGRSEKTVTNWIKLFLEGGFEQLLAHHYPKDRGSRLSPYKAAIRQYRRNHPRHKLEDLQQWLKEEHGVEVEYSWLFRYIGLHNL